MNCPHLETWFQKLSAAGYAKTSEQTGRPPKPGAYNCIAWAAHDTSNWWWPDPDSYWPFWTRRETNVRCFVHTFQWLGYRICASSSKEFGYEKVALFKCAGAITHMARQLSDGSWTSKIGEAEDITHFTLDALESYGSGSMDSASYGRPFLFMRRLVLISGLVRVVQWTLQRLETRR